MTTNKKSSKTSSKTIAKKSEAKSAFFTSVKNILHRAQGTAYKAVNSVMVVAYWHVGRLIVEDEQKGKRKAEYGKAVLQDLSDRLNKEFKEGFSVQSLWNMRQFYNTFPILSTVWRESKGSKTIDVLANEKKSLIRSTLLSESAE